ncbi:MAG: hypothetical protein AB8B56_01775 [Crocinitomicaceae bacterium]
MSKLTRQIKDIQFQAERLISGNPDGEELQQFSNYNEEMKNYMLLNIDDSDLRKVILEIPDVMDIETDTKSTPFLVLLFLGIATLGISAFYISYVANMRRTRQIQNNIQTVRGKYSSLEFLMKVRD